MDRQVFLTALETQGSSIVITSLILVHLVKMIYALFLAPAVHQGIVRNPSPLVPPSGQPSAACRWGRDSPVSSFCGGWWWSIYKIYKIAGQNLGTFPYCMAGDAFIFLPSVSLTVLSGASGSVWVYLVGLITST